MAGVARRRLPHPATSHQIVLKGYWMCTQSSTMWDFDSDVEYDSEYSDGEPYFALKEEVRRGDWNAAKLALDAGEN